MVLEAGPNPGPTERPTLLFSSLRFKLLLFSAVLLVFSGVLFGLITYSNSRDVLGQVIGRHLYREATNAAARLAATLEAERGAVRTASRQDLMREIRVGDIDKRVSVFLATLKEGHPSCLDFLVIDPSRRVVAASRPELLGPAPSWANAAGDALGGTELLLGPVVSSAHGRSAVQFAVPVYDPDAAGTVIGALVGVYDWEGVTAVVDEVRSKLADLGLDADVLIADEGGTVIRGAPGPGSSVLAGRSLRSAGWRSVDRASRERQPEFFTEEAAGLLVGHARLGEESPAWEVLIAEPLDSALAPVREMTRELTLALAATLAVALAIAAVGAGRVVRPLTELTRAIRGLGRGDSLVRPVSVRARDEVGVLAAAFNRMASELERAQRELVDAAKFAFVGELAAGVAHEIRTPLGVLRSSTQILDRSLPAERDAQTGELVQMIRAEVDRVERVVTELLNLARPRQLQLEATPVAAPVFRAADFVEPQAREKGITIVRGGSRDGSAALCDPELIYQVSLNLLVNAIQVLTEEGKIEVTVLPRVGSVVAFEIRDNGPGIPEDMRSRVFLPFVSLRTGGTGLGLTFVQRVIQEHHGRVFLENDVGGGTRVRVELPAAEAAA